MLHVINMLIIMKQNKIVKKFMNIKNIYIVFILFFNLSFIDAFGGLNKDTAFDKIKKYIQKDSSVADYYSITEDAFYIYESAEHKKTNLPEYSFPFRKIDKRIRMKGMRIAIDPGHLGGNYAIAEERYIDMLPCEDVGFQTHLQFDEGTLALLTAKVLRNLLVEAGAEVMLTREQVGKEAGPLTLHNRAEMINAFQPDLTIIIHYNVHTPCSAANNKTLPTHHNYNMAFIGGAFGSGDLSTKQSRAEFARMMATDDLEQSAKLCKHILEHMQKQLGVPSVNDADNPPYLEQLCLKVSEGVYARNLALTRLVHGPICYGESLCQNNIEECQLLARKDFYLDDIVGPQRVVKVAQAYFDGIFAFIKEEQ